MALKVRRVVTACSNVIWRRPGHQSCGVSTGPDGTIFRVISGEIEMRIDIGGKVLHAVG
jgi:hypothetical protein